MTESGDDFASSELAFVIHPAAEHVSVDVLLNALDHIRRLLRDVDYAIHGGKYRSRWDVRRLQSSSPTIAVRPSAANGNRPSAVHEIGVGLRLVTSGVDYPPPYFTEQSLLNLKAMRRVFRGRDCARSIAVQEDGGQVASIGCDISAKAERILGAGYHNLGALEGTLEAINVHRSPIITVWDRVYGSPVRCSIPQEDEWISRVKALLGKRVLVSGVIHHFVNGTPRSIRNISKIEDVTPEQRLPEAEFGSIPDAKAADNPAAFLQAVREPSREY